MMRWGIQLLCGLVFCGLAFAQDSAPSPAGISGSYRVGPGDVLDIVVFEVDELSRPATIGPNGAIALPLIGEVRVEGLTTLGIAARLERLYGESLLRDPQISVAVKEFRSQPVSVFGAVERPGIYQLQGRRRLLEVLAMAGGLAKDVGDEIVISRQGVTGDAAAWEAAGEPLLSAPQACDAGSTGGGNEAVREPAAREQAARNEATGDEPNESQAGASVNRGGESRVSVRGLLAGGDEAADNPWITPYDTIRVSKAGMVYVLGAVARPGGYPIEQDSITVLRAISLAQGLDRRAARQNARVIRQQGAAKQEIAVRIDDILHGKVADAELCDNDILFVPDSRAKGALSRGAEAAIQLATGVIIWRR